MHLFFAWLLLVVFTSMSGEQVKAEARSGERIEILPVKWSLSDHGELTLLYRLPCGSSELGVFLRNTGLDTIRIGMATNRPHHRCTGISRVKSVKLTHMSFDSQVSIESFNPTLESLRYQFYRGDRTRKVYDPNRADGYENGIELAYQSQCGHYMGVVASLSIDQAPLMGAIESLTDFDAECSEPGESVRAVTGLSIASHYAGHGSIASLPYEIAIAPIKPGSLRLHHKDREGLQFRYLRRCNESPIGILNRRRDSHIEFAIVVARYSRDICPQGGPKKLWSQYITRIFKRSDLESLRPISRQTKAGFEFLIDEPRDVELLAENKVHVTTYSDCIPVLGTLIAEKRNHRFLGLIRYHSKGDKKCDKAINEVEITSTIPPRLAEMGVSGPLRLFQ